MFYPFKMIGLSLCEPFFILTDARVLNKTENGESLPLPVGPLPSHDGRTDHLYVLRLFTFSYLFLSFSYSPSPP